MRANLLRLLFFTIVISAAMIPLYARADKADSLYREGLELENKGQRDFAVFKYFTITRKYPKSKWAAAALFKIGEFYYENKDYFNARENFERLAAEYPRSSFAQDGKLYLEKIAGASKDRDTERYVKSIISSIESLQSEERWDDVASECDKLLSCGQLSSEDRQKMLECYNQCGSAYLNDGKLEKAKTVYEKIVRLTPEDKEAVNKLYEVNKLLQAAPE